ncbi:hypothetical protein [Methanolobus profundi]|uniref:Cytochrome b561 domain-containing protein n=1 Tax=Methanolobus profundi TaxID=487685 RepID=A0A1I4NKI0_9EURY|nr:hypothetical protein [Methanolobus profundi]SFM16034.1 hypothetical protein SAMN04488696_0113 [Methanolobus profundi]
MFTQFNQAFFNLLLQLLSVIVLAVAVSQVSKDPMRKHCHLVSVAVLLQLLSILAFMFPSMSTLRDIGVGSSLQTQMYLHHFAGLVVILFSVYIKLAVDGRIRHIVNPFSLMKITLAIWILVFIGGLSLYFSLWEGISFI